MQVLCNKCSAVCNENGVNVRDTSKKVNWYTKVYMYLPILRVMHDPFLNLNHKKNVLNLSFEKRIDESIDFRSKQQAKI